MSYIVNRYGALPPSSPEQKEVGLRYQHKLGRNYYNKLVAAENQRRRQIWGDEQCPKPDHPPQITYDENGKKKEIYCKCDECKADWKALREGFYAWPYLDVTPLRNEAIKTGLYWGTYMKVEEAFASAQKKTKFYEPVQFKPWYKGGIVAAVQLQKNLNPENYYKIQTEYDKREGNRKGQRHSIRIRIGTIKNKPLFSEPIFFEMHRPLMSAPVWIVICLDYIASREVWSVNITCKAPVRTDNAVSGVVAIDVGWRVLDDGSLRLAYATGNDGKTHELTMPPSWRERSDRADRIRKYRTERLNELKVKDPRFNILKSSRSVKDYAERMGYINADLVEWVKREQHLRAYELGCRHGSVESRRDAMRVWLRKLRRQYATAVIKNSSHKEMKDHKKAVKARMTPASRRNAHHGAPGEIIEEVGKVFNRQTGVAVVEAPGTTSTCAKCGAEMIVGAERMTMCERCGAQEDRDRVSTRNLLRLYFSGKSEKPTARKQTTRFAKRHKKNDQQKQCQLSGL